ncbi:sugar transferase [Runella salmonicolor]|uniref:Sugar transferase n=1 Tax=Runella salmonicolor TaxID=2950278 RepID=A0ABT1FUL1_9BACT|nr:sugar transferase [Runella salmonicolor]MCP1384348.1 sugar transferase [Runella salmonicolor]
MSYQRFLKPVIDKISAFCILLLTLPITLVVTALLYFYNQGKPFFFQLRPGQNGKIFKIIKFKTMNDRRAANGELLPDSARLTPVGRFVRQTSLDELPQLINVLKGDMSLVGPRPLLPEYLSLYSQRQQRRHEVKPGITGWAQINGRNTISWSQKFEYDIWYAEHISLGLDIKILWLTLIKVFKREGISSETSVTMEKFKGNN